MIKWSNRKYLGNDTEEQLLEQQKDLKTNRYVCEWIVDQLHGIERWSPTLKT